MFDIKPITSLKPTDCGATCLQMLLAYYDIDVDLDTLIKDCNTGINGCTAGDIMRAGRKYGLDMKAWKDIKGEDQAPEEASTISVDLFKQDRPSIIWWKYRHFCVLCGLDESGQVVICNPDRGRYRMSKGIFNSFYSGISLTNGIPEEAED